MAAPFQVQHVLAVGGIHDVSMIRMSSWLIDYKVESSCHYWFPYPGIRYLKLYMAVMTPVQEEVQAFTWSSAEIGALKVWLSGFSLIGC